MTRRNRRVSGDGYIPYEKYAIIEYRIHWGNENGDSCNIEIFEGKHWRHARNLVEQCEAGLRDEFRDNLRIVWIERVERWIDQHGEPMSGHDDFEILWDRGESD